MPLEFSQKCPRIGVPESDRSVPTPTCECASIRAERKAFDRCRMPGERSQGFSGVGVPQPDSVPTSTCECASIGTVRNDTHRTGMPRECS